MQKPDGDNPQAKMMVVQMLKDGLIKKWNY
jgi:hypothetical protein